MMRMCPLDRIWEPAARLVALEQPFLAASAASVAVVVVVVPGNLLRSQATEDRAALEALAALGPQAALELLVAADSPQRAGAVAVAVAMVAQLAEPLDQADQADLGSSVSFGKNALGRYHSEECRRWFAAGRLVDSSFCR